MGCAPSSPAAVAPAPAPSSTRRVLGVIPARYGSTRFPGKPLADLAGKPMVWHTYTNAKSSTVLTKLVVATDDDRIRAAVEGFGGEVVMTPVDLERFVNADVVVVAACHSIKMSSSIVIIKN